MGNSIFFLECNLVHRTSTWVLHVVVLIIRIFMIDLNRKSTIQKKLNWSKNQPKKIDVLIDWWSIFYWPISSNFMVLRPPAVQILRFIHTCMVRTCQKKNWKSDNKKIKRSIIYDRKFMIAAKNWFLTTDQSIMIENRFLTTDQSIIIENRYLIGITSYT